MEEHAWPHKYRPTNIIAKLCGNAMQSNPVVNFGKQIIEKALLELIVRKQNGLFQMMCICLQKECYLTPI